MWIYAAMKVNVNKLKAGWELAGLVAQNVMGWKRPSAG
jgi:hypothetical protein